MKIRSVLIVGVIGVSASAAVAADAINGASSGQRAIQPNERAISPPTQQRGLAPQSLRNAPTSHNRKRTDSVGGSSSTPGSMSQRKQRFERDSNSSLSDTIERRRERFENGS